MTPLWKILDANELKRLQVLDYQVFDSIRNWYNFETNEVKNSPKMQKLFESIRNNRSVMTLFVGEAANENGILQTHIPLSEYRFYPWRQNQMQEFIKFFAHLVCLTSLSFDLRFCTISTIQYFLEDEHFGFVHTLSLDHWDAASSALSETDKALLGAFPQETRWSSLRILSLSNSKQSYSRLTESDSETSDTQDCSLLFQLLPSIFHLETLTLRYWKLSRLDMLTNLVANSTSLRHFSLNHIYLTENGNDWGKLLVDAIKSNSSVQRLTLNDINVSEDVLCVMATQALAVHPCIEVVALKFNDRRSKSIMASKLNDSLVQMLQKNRRITHVVTNYAGNKSVSPRVDLQMRLNHIYKLTDITCKTEIKDTRTQQPEKWPVEALIHARDDLGCLHLLLLEYPVMVQMAFRSVRYRNANFPPIVT